MNVSISFDQYFLVCQRDRNVSIDFIYFFSLSDTFVKPNLWLLVNPSIACPIQYGENGADLQTEPAEEIHTAPLDPAATRHQLSTELRLFSCHDASLQEELLHSVSSSTEYMVQYTSILTLWTIKGKLHQLGTLEYIYSSSGVLLHVRKVA